MSRISGLGIDAVFQALKQSGLDLMPGGGAEIFAEETRVKLCPEKISGGRWLEIMEIAHNAGIKTNATMLYGHVESVEDRVDHLLKLRDLQDRTGRIPGIYPPGLPSKEHRDRRFYSSGIDDLKTIAISRLVLDNFDHIKAYLDNAGRKDFPGGPFVRGRRYRRDHNRGKNNPYGWGHDLRGHDKG